MMAQCTVSDVFLSASKRKIHFTQKFQLLKRGRKQKNFCTPSMLHSLSATMEDNDYMYNIVKNMATNEPVLSSKCHPLENKVAFIFMGDSSHIYFKFLDYFSLYEIIEKSGLRDEEYTIIRIPKVSKGRMQLDTFEKTLFPDVQAISHYHTSSCFKIAVFVPYAYYTVPFRCKRDAHLTPFCTQCTGEKYSKSYLSFRSKVLESCGLSDSATAEERQMRSNKRYVLISRIPLDRRKVTQRIVVNENDLVEVIGREFPSVNLTVVHMEKLGVCQQVELAHKTDVLMGPHGAGLVHLWWMQDDAVTLEFEPDYKRDNPTFRVLSALTGRRYERVKLYEAPGTPPNDDSHINFVVNVDEVIAKLRTL